MNSHKCSFGTRCSENARKIPEERHKGGERTEEEVQEDICTSEREIARMRIQAKLGFNLQLRWEQRLGWRKQSERKHEVSKGKRLVSGYSWTSEDTPKHEVLNTKTLQREKEANVITLAGLKIFSKVGEQVGETIVGALEVHANGFYYATASPYFCFSFLYTDLQKVFFRVGDEKMSPLLHFHYHDCITVGTETRQNIQFRLVQTPVRQKRSYNDLYKINEDLKNFVHNVQEKWRGVPVVHYSPFVDAEVRKADEFQGNHPSKAPTFFGLTLFSLVGLVDEPFVVVNLHEIEMVNLKLKPELPKPMEIDMTIVFKDLARDPVIINSIPIDKLDFIKDGFNFARVKYYETGFDAISWVSIVRRAAKYREIIDWSYFETRETINYYNAAVICESDTRGEERYEED